MRSGDSLATEYLRRAPKVEMHVHLEGALRPERLFQILRRHRLHPHIRSPEDLGFLYRHANFAEFLDHFRFAVTAMRDVQDVHDVALDLFRELAAQEVVYAEVIFSPVIFVRMGMPLGELLAAVVEAESEALGGGARMPGREAAPIAPRYNLVVDLVRNFGPESAESLAGELARISHPRVVGVHLGGDEVGFPARLFAAAFAGAAAAGLGRAAHAGEADGPGSVRDALEILGVQRIGHGIRSVEDPGLLRELVRRGTTLEVCPTSNLRTGVVASVERHPLPELVRAGVRATLGADDPSYFDTDLTGEMLVAHFGLGLPLERVDALVDAGLEAAFLPEAERSARLADLRARRAAVRAGLGMAR
jgi:adenosine deaminase